MSLGKLFLATSKEAWTTTNSTEVTNTMTSPSSSDLVALLSFLLKSHPPLALVAKPPPPESPPLYPLEKPPLSLRFLLFPSINLPWAALHSWPDLSTFFQL